MCGQFHGIREFGDSVTRLLVRNVILLSSFGPLYSTKRWNHILMTRTWIKTSKQPDSLCRKCFQAKERVACLLVAAMPPVWTTPLHLNTPASEPNPWRPDPAPFLPVSWGVFPERLCVWKWGCRLLCDRQTRSVRLLLRRVKSPFSLLWSCEAFFCLGLVWDFAPTVALPTWNCYFCLRIEMFGILSACDQNICFRFCLPVCVNLFLWTSYFDLNVWKWDKKCLLNTKVTVIAATSFSIVAVHLFQGVQPAQKATHVYIQVGVGVVCSVSFFVFVRA